jgi:hypothetical protein
MSPEWRRRLLRYALAALAALALAFSMRAWEARGRTVRLAYDAPPGALVVTIRDDDGRMARRAEFGPGIERQHEITLPDAEWRVELRMGQERRMRTVVTGPGQDTVRVDWRR